MKTPKLNTPDGKIDAVNGGNYWMRYPNCAWEPVQIRFEFEEWRIAFLGSNYLRRLDFEFDKAEFVENKPPQDLPKRDAKGDRLLLVATRKDGFRRIGYFKHITIDDSSAGRVWVSARTGKSALSEEFIAESVSVTVQ